uniref:Uncharacterized protein n=1 Tax=Anguilla anguilla TaxID=7936 RepID=A0A0E9TJJ2_ANGAN
MGASRTKRQTESYTLSKDRRVTGVRSSSQIPSFPFL